MGKPIDRHTKDTSLSNQWLSISTKTCNWLLSPISTFKPLNLSKMTL